MTMVGVDDGQDRRNRLKMVALGLLVLVSTSCGSSLADQSPKRQAGAIDAYIRDHGFHGTVLVAHRGKVILDKAYGLSNPSKEIKNTTETVFAIGSITKTFTAAAVMRLVQEGRLALDRRIGSYVPEFDFEPWKPITIRQLLSHTSGMWRETEVDEEVAPFIEVAERNHGTPLFCSPGSCFNYSNMGYEALGVIIERVTGERYEEYVEQAFFKPLRLRSTGATVGARKVRNQAIGGIVFNGELAPGKTAGEGAASVGVSVGGIYSTTGDLYRWINALRGGRVLPARVFRDMVKGHSPTAIGPYDEYGYGWIAVKSGSAFWHSGGIADAFASLVFIDDDRDVVVVALSNDYNTSALMFNRVYDFERDARDRARGLGWVLPVASVFALIAALFLVLRLVRHLRRRDLVFARPTLRRLTVLVLVPGLVALFAWGETIAPLRRIGSATIAWTVAPMWKQRLLTVVALYVLLAAVAAYAFVRRPGQPGSRSD